MNILDVNTNKVFFVNMIDIFSIHRNDYDLKNKTYKCNHNLFSNFKRKGDTFVTKYKIENHFAINDDDKLVFANIQNYNINNQECVYDILCDINKELEKIYNLFLYKGYVAAISKILNKNITDISIIADHIKKLNIKNRYTHYIFIDNEYIVIMIDIIPKII